MIQYLNEIDTSIFLFFNGFNSPFWDKIMVIISGKLTWVPLYLIAILFFFKKGGVKIGAITLISAILLIAIADLSSVHLFKNVFERLRPCHNESIQHLVHTVNHCGGKYGFVSSHAANSFSFAVFSYLIFKNKYYKISIIIWAIVVSYSRIYLGVHYFGDVLCGAILGTISAIIIFKIYIKVIQRINLTFN